MAFSLFNKKGSEPQKSPASRAAPGGTPVKGGERGGKPAKAVPADGAATSAKIDRIEADMASLDFSAELTAGRAKSGAKPIVEHGFGGGAKPPAPAAGPDGQSARSGSGSVMTMEVQESPFEAAPALEEAAILYANRQDAIAQGVLEEAIHAADIAPQAARQAWLMLFDLFENQGKRVEFESLALEYAVKFETSPPAFSDRSVVKNVAARGGEGALLSFGGRLDAQAGRQFEHARTLAAKHRVLRIDFSKVEGIDADGSSQLRACLAALRRSGHEVSYLGAERLVEVLGTLTETGRSGDPETYWLLLLDIYQALGMQAQFEEAALNYCITYEVSPPSWVDVPDKAAKTLTPAGPTTEQKPGDACYLKGEIEGNAAELLKEVEDFAAGQTHVIIDVYNVKRMDFIAAGSLLNLVSSLASIDKQVEIRGPSPLIANLFVTMGFPAYARLARRRAK